MKKLIPSILIGACIGVCLAFLFLFVRVKFADGIAQFFDARKEATVPIVEAIKSPFAKDVEHYKITAHTPTVPSEGKALLTDLEAMTITLYMDGEQVEQYPIKSVGREGTAWQTPVGTFDMSYKKENHFSSIGHVWMPYSMHFFGNYFIHGWPYYPDGTPVAEGYSGGCIRMETELAKHVYEFVDSETTLVVVNPDEQGESFADMEYEIDGELPDLSAYAYLVADIETGEVVAANNQRAVAGRDFAPLMTAMISLEGLNQYPDVTFDDKSMTVGDVLYALILEDRDKAAELLYDRRNHAQYLLDMDNRAKSIGMTQTVYEDVYGNDPETKTTLEDTFRLVQYVNWYKPFLIKALGKAEYEKDEVKFASVHPLAGSENYVAGYADRENQTMLTVVTALGDKKFVVIVEGSQDAGGDTEKLLSWINSSVRVK